MQPLVHNVQPATVAASSTKRPLPIDRRTGKSGLGAGLTEFEVSRALAGARRAKDIANELFANGFRGGPGVTPEDIAALGVPRLEELRAQIGRGSAADEFAGYSLNSTLTGTGTQA